MKKTKSTETLTTPTQLAQPAPKVTLALQFTGQQALFIRRAMTEANYTSAVAFATQAVLNEAEATVGEEPPKADPKPRKGRPVPADAVALGLDAKEYGRRVRVLKTAGIEPTADAVARVPAKVQKAAPALDTAAE